MQRITTLAVTARCSLSRDGTVFGRVNHPASPASVAIGRKNCTRVYERRQLHVSNENFANAFWVGAGEHLKVFFPGVRHLHHVFGQLAKGAPILWIKQQDQSNPLSRIFTPPGMALRMKGIGAHRAQARCRLWYHSQTLRLGWHHGITGSWADPLMPRSLRSAAQT